MSGVMHPEERVKMVIETARAVLDERLPAAGVPDVRARQDQQVAVGGIEFGDQRVGHHPHSAHRGDRVTRLGHRDDVEPDAGEAARAQFRNEVPDLPIGERVVEADVCSPVAS